MRGGLFWKGWGCFWTQKSPFQWGKAKSEGLTDRKSLMPSRYCALFVLCWPAHSCSLLFSRLLCCSSQCLLFLIFRDRFSCCPGLPLSLYVIKDDLEFLILWTLLPRCWGYEPAWPVSFCSNSCPSTYLTSLLKRIHSVLRSFSWYIMSLSEVLSSRSNTFKCLLPPTSLVSAHGWCAPMAPISDPIHFLLVATKYPLNELRTKPLPQKLMPMAPRIAKMCKLIKFHILPLPKHDLLGHLLLDDKHGCFYCMVTIRHKLPGQVSR